MTINKDQIVELVARNTHETKAVTRKVLDEAMEVIRGFLKSGEQVRIAALGTFRVDQSAEKNGVNPQTLEPIKIPPTKYVRFSASAGCKDFIRS